MAFLGKIGKSLGIGDLTHKPFKALEAIIPTAAGAFLGGPVGAGIGNALGQKLQGASIKDSVLGGLETYGLGSGAVAGADYISSAGGVGNAIKSLPSTIGNAASDLGSELKDTFSGAASTAKNALGFPTSTVDAASGLPASTAAASSAGAGGGLTDVGLTSQLAGNLGTGASGASTAADAAALPASTGGGGLLSTAKDFLTNNGRTIASLAPVAMQVANGNQTTQEQKLLEQQAAQLSQQGNQLTNTLNTGKLPEGIQQNFDTALQDAITSIKSKYASLGLSGSTQESQEIQSANERVKGLQAQQLESLATQGLNMTNSSSDLYKNIMQTNINSNADLSSAIAAAVGSLGGSGDTQQPKAA